MTQGERIAADLRRAWDGAPWHGPSAAELYGRLTARQAATRRARGSHTAWELLLHSTVWVETPQQRFADPAYDPPTDFPPPTEKSDAAWVRDRQALGVAVERLAAHVATLDDATLARNVGSRGYTYLTMCDGVAQHLAYHAGQAAILAMKEETAGVIAPPPLIVLAAIGLSELGRRWWALRLSLPWFVGAALIVAGVALVLWAERHFVRQHTPAAPWHASRALVQDGPYRITRNPMYVGFLIAFLGIGLMRGYVLYLLMLPVLWAVLLVGVVLREERYLRRRFGALYEEFLARTRRWLA